MQPRVAIARALAYEPEILLMDEPFASVDAKTRADFEDLIVRVQQEYHVTVVFVTHDFDESVYLGDRIVMLTPAPTRGQEILAYAFRSRTTRSRPRSFPSSPACGPTSTTRSRRGVGSGRALAGRRDPHGSAV
jgi:ABC-type nitrate/sulfonate/bicarbonate transport system ATPase subunit